MNTPESKRWLVNLLTQAEDIPTRAGQALWYGYVLMGSVASLVASEFVKKGVENLQLEQLSQADEPIRIITLISGITTCSLGVKLVNPAINRLVACSQDHFAFIRRFRR